LTVFRHIYISLQGKHVIHKQYFIKKESGFVLIITDPDLLLELEQMYGKFLFKVSIIDMYSHYNTKMGGFDLLDYFVFVYCVIYPLIKWWYCKVPIFRTTPLISDKSHGFTAFLATGKQ
jgi:hypothetical protein